MKMIKGINSITIISSLVLVMLLCVSLTSAVGCNLYGHSCWGGHGKRGAPDKAQMQPLNNDWFLSRLAKSNRRFIPIRDMGLIKQIKENEIMKQLRDKENYDNSDRKAFIDGNIFNAESFEERQPNERNPKDLIFMNGDEANSDKLHLMQLLEDNGEAPQ